MIRKIVTFAALSLLAAAASGLAQFEIPDWDNSVRFEVLVSQHPVRPGDEFQVALVADIVDGYHLYGPEEQEPSRTEVHVMSESLKAGEPVYPEPIRRNLEGLGEYDLYEGNIAIKVPVTLSDGDLDGDAKLEVRYQVCTDFACSAPTSDELEIPLTTGEPGSTVEPLHSHVFGKK